MNLKNRFRQKEEDLRMVHTDPNLHTTMCEKLISWLPTIPREYVVVCIGTDRSTGDSLGPFAGTLLTEMKPKHITVYGTLGDPVHAKNLQDYISLIKEQHKNPYIIAVDASLGKTTSVGSLIAGMGPVKPGAALNKPLPSIGDVHLTGVVNISGFMEYSILQNTRLSVVVEMAKKIAAILEAVDNRLSYSNSFPAVVRTHQLEQPQPTAEI